LKTFLAGAAAVGLAASLAYAQGPAAPAAGAAAPAAARPARPPRLPTQAQWDAAPGVKTYVAKAVALAGNDPDLKFDVGIFCQPSGGATNADRQHLGVPDSEPHLQPYPTPAKAVPVPATRLADNWWRFGDTGVGMWLFTTPQGYILFDTGNSEDDITKILEPEMKRVGLDPKLIKYVVIGHYHLDHTGGLAYVQKTYHPKVIMGRDDWPLYFKALQSTTGQAARLRDRTPATHDIDATDGMKITVDGLTATIYEMTGHTPGSLGMIVPVKFQGRDHPILVVTAGTDFPNRESFIGGYEHIWDEGIRAKVESVVQVHPNTNMNTLAREKYVSEHYPPAKNPILYGPERTARYLNIMRACSQARLEAMGW
jgi:metallo-beta-lactamase class B